MIILNIKGLTSRREVGASVCVCVCVYACACSNPRVTVPRPSFHLSLIRFLTCQVDYVVEYHANNQNVVRGLVGIIFEHFNVIL